MTDRPTPEQIIIDIAAETYGTDLFPPVDLAVIRALLEREGWTLDQVSAHVARRLLVGWAAHLPEKLVEYGYVIVHPDDVPPYPGPDVLGDRYRLGYNDCRRHIFAAAEQEPTS